MSDTSIVDQRRSFWGGGIDAEREAIADALADGITFADMLEATSAFVSVRKSADQSVLSSTTLVDDTHLSIPVAALGIYTFRGVLIYEAGTTGDLKIALTVPAGASLSWWSTGLRNTDSIASGGIDGTAVVASGTSRVHGGVGAGTKLGVNIAGLVRVGETAGNLLLRFAQSATEAVNTTIFTDSYIESRKIA